MFGNKKLKKKIDNIISERPKYNIADEAFETQNLARSAAFGKDRSIQMQQANIEQQAAQDSNAARDVTSSTSDLLSTIAAINANKGANTRGLAQDEAGMQNQKMQQLYNVNQGMIDEKDKAWNYNVNVPYQQKLQRANEALRRRQMLTDALTGAGITMGGSAATSGTTENGGSGNGEGNSSGGFMGMFSSMFSDRRLKTDIKPMDKGLDVVLRMSPVEFKYIRNMDDRVHLGFIAQDVRDVLPEIVLEAEYGQEKRLAIRDNEIIPVLVNAIKELSGELNKLREEVQSLKSVTV